MTLTEVPLIESIRSTQLKSKSVIGIDPEIVFTIRLSSSQSAALFILSSSLGLRRKDHLGELYTEGGYYYARKGKVVFYAQLNTTP
jgi:hypothetical protein